MLLPPLIHIVKCCDQSCAAQYEREMDKLEQFQHRATKMTAGQEHLKSGSES